MTSTSVPPALEEPIGPPERLVLPAATLRALPRVDLLPPELRERQRLRALQRGLVASVVAAGLVVAGLHTVAVSHEHAAQRASDVQAQQGAVLTAEKHRYADVPLVLAKATAAKAELSAAMGQEVRWSLLLDDLDRRMPDGVWLTGLDVTPAAVTTGTTGAAAGAATSAASAAGTAAGATGTSAEAAASGSGAGVATIRFTGSAVSQPAVATWLRVLAAVPGFSGAYLTSSTEAPSSTSVAASTYTFTTSVTVTVAALSHRYTTGSGS